MFSTFSSQLAFDPEARTVTVLELEGGRYVERAVLAPADEPEVSLPFTVTIRPAEMCS